MKTPAQVLRQSIRFLKEHPFLFIPFIFYFYTFSRTVGSGAPAMHINSSLSGVISTHVDSHNLMLITGWLFKYLPVGELAARFNLVSAFYGAIAVVGFYFSLLTVTGKRSLSAWGSAFLMVSYSVWWHSTIYESYSINAAFTTWTLFLLLRLEATKNIQYLFWACFMAGLSVFNHISMGMLCVGVAVAGITFVRKEKLPFRILLRCFGIAILGLFPWIVTLIRDCTALGLSFGLNQAFFGPFKGIMLGGTWRSNLNDLGLLLLQDHPSPFLLLIPYGFYLFGKRSRLSGPAFLGTSVHMILNSVFAWTYQTWNKYSHGQPALVYYTFYGAVALTTILVLSEKKIGRSWNRFVYGALALCLVAYPVVYSKIPTWGNNPKSIWYERYNSNHAGNAYDISTYIVNPNKRNFREYAHYAEALFKSLPTNAILFEDDGRSYYQLTDYYQKHLKQRTDLRVIMMNSFAYDDIGWGLNPKALAKWISYCYEHDLPFFTISLNYPFSRGYQLLPGRERYRFEKHFIDTEHYIYRLVTRTEINDSFLDLQFNDNKAIRLGKPGTWTNITDQNSRFSFRGSMVMQNMKAYRAENWFKGDQIFYRGEGPGAWFEIEIQSNEKVSVSGSLDLRLTTANDYGIAKIYLNQEEVTSRIDLYSNEVWSKEVRFPAKLIPGLNRIVFSIEDKNPKSGDFVIGVDAIRWAK
jgi:hypothetical protein